jgi:hypothetical protein
VNSKGCRDHVGWSLALALLAVALAPLAGAAQEGNIKDSPLFHGVKDPKIIGTQVRTALPAYERGLTLLNSSPDADTTASGVRFLLDAYRYLRAAYEGNQLILTTAKYPDPLLEYQNRQIMDLRHRLLHCTSNRDNLAQQASESIRIACIDGLTGGLRTLRVLVGIAP